MLINLAREALQKSNWPVEVQTGKYAFKLGPGTRNVRSLT